MQSSKWIFNIELGGFEVDLSIAFRLFFSVHGKKVQSFPLVHRIPAACSEATKKTHSLPRNSGLGFRIGLFDLVWSVALIASLSSATSTFTRTRRSGAFDPLSDLPAVPPVLPLIVDIDNIDATRETLDANNHYRIILCMVTRAGHPLAKVRIDLTDDETPTPDLVKSRLLAELPPSHDATTQITRGRASEEAANLSATVVVATRNRPEQLLECLTSILEGTAPVERLIVVDNAPSDNRTEELMENRMKHDNRLLYVREDRQGLAHAHNAALPHLTTDIVAFTDDDVLAETHWLEKLVSTFAEDARAVCVTGLILPRELETLPQQWVEGNATYDKGLHRHVFDGQGASEEHPLLPYASGACGSGANMAFRTSYLLDAGGFEIALGTGTVAMGGDDLAAFYDVVASGKRLVYEPAAMVLHPHYRDYAALRRQVYGYGAGLGAHLMRCVLLDPKMIFFFLKNAVALRSRATEVLHPSVDGLPPYPKDLLREHRRGLMAGPWRYLRSRRHVKQLQAMEQTQ